MSIKSNCWRSSFKIPKFANSLFNTLALNNNSSRSSRILLGTRHHQRRVNREMPHQKAVFISLMCLSCQIEATRSRKKIHSQKNNSLCSSIYRHSSLLAALKLQSLQISSPLHAIILPVKWLHRWRLSRVLSQRKAWSFSRLYRKRHLAWWTLR